MTFVHLPADLVRKGVCRGFPSPGLVVLVGSLLSGAVRNDIANSIVNVDFATGDLTVWTASAVNADGHLAKLLIRVVDLGGVESAGFSTGEFTTAPFVSTLEQTFTVDAVEPVSSVEFSLPDVRPDATGTGSRVFLNSLIVSSCGPREALAVIL
ncbi:MAG: hypothetical protein MN733_21930 [Nitrososphaera sp.]|nr:hypothetical protein [Nitrososphaera sp.]